MFCVPEIYRVKQGDLASDSGYGNNGVFEIGAIISGRELFVVASDGEGWEHVSVSVRQGKRSYTPTWNEMCHVKRQFWGQEDVVMQLHPAQSEWINNHESVLHLWRPVDTAIPLPPSIMVGIKDVTQREIEDWVIAESNGIPMVHNAR